MFFFSKYSDHLFLYNLFKHSYLNISEERITATAWQPHIFQQQQPWLKIEKNKDCYLKIFHVKTFQIQLSQPR